VAVCWLATIGAGFAQRFPQTLPANTSAGVTATNPGSGAPARKRILNRRVQLMRDYMKDGSIS
jgi:hypothetical protein